MATKKKTLDPKFITRVQKIRSFANDPAFGILVKDYYLEILNEFASLHSRIWPKLPINDYGFSGPENWVTNRQAAILEVHIVIGMIAGHYETQPNDLQDIFISIRVNRVNAIMNRLLLHDRHYCHSDKPRSHCSSSDLHHNHSSRNHSSPDNSNRSHSTHDLTEKPHLKPDIVKEKSLVPVSTVEPIPCSNMDHDGTESNDSGKEDNGHKDHRDKDHSLSDEDQNQHQHDSDTASHSGLTKSHTLSNIQPVSDINSIIKKLAMSPLSGAEIAGQEDHSFNKSNNGLGQFSNNIGTPTIFGFYHIYVRIKAIIHPAPLFLSFIISLYISVLLFIPIPLPRFSSLSFLSIKFGILFPCL